MITKIFVGCEVTHDLRFALENSSSWKQALIEWKNLGQGLEFVKVGKKRYLGILSEECLLPLTEAETMIAKINTILAKHCPDFDLETLHFELFPQILVA